MDLYRSAITPPGFDRLLLVMVVVALAASGCVGGSHAAEAGSPIAGFLGEDQSDPEAARAGFAEQDLIHQEAIAACMKQQGFDYVPRASSDVVIFGGAEGIDDGSREYAERYGFGITTQRYGQEEVGPGLVGHDNGPLAGSGPEDDPNTQIVEAMDEGTRKAYFEALHGPEESATAFGSESVTDEQLEGGDLAFEPRGCEGEAWSQNETSRFYQDFSVEMDDMYAAIDADPRLQEKRNETNACVAGKGYEFAGFESEDFWTSFDDDLDRVDELRGRSPGEDLTDEDFASMTPEELEAVFNQPREFTDEAKTLLGQLQAEETALATAVWDCGGSFSATDELYQEVAREYEQRFLDENADRPTDYKADS